MPTLSAYSGEAKLLCQSKLPCLIEASRFDQGQQDYLLFVLGSSLNWWLYLLFTADRVITSRHRWIQQLLAIEFNELLLDQIWKLWDPNSTMLMSYIVIHLFTFGKSLQVYQANIYLTSRVGYIVAA